MNFVEFLDDLKTKVTEELKENSKIKSRIFCFKGKGPPEEMVMDAMPSTQILRGVIKKAIKKFNLQDIIMVTEAWITTVKDNEEMNKKMNKYGKVSNCPDKQDIVLITHMNVLRETVIVGHIENDCIKEWSSTSNLPRPEGRLQNLFETSGNN